MTEWRCVLRNPAEMIHMLIQSNDFEPDFSIISFVEVLNAIITSMWPHTFESSLKFLNCVFSDTLVIQISCTNNLLPTFNFGIEFHL